MLAKYVSMVKCRKVFKLSGDGGHGKKRGGYTLPDFSTLPANYDLPRLGG